MTRHRRQLNRVAEKAGESVPGRSEFAPQLIDSRADGLEASTDEQLWELFRAEGNQAAVAELFRRHQGPLLVFLTGHTHDSQRAEELVQTAFQRLIERPDQFTAGRRFKPWLYSIVAHLSIDAHRHLGKERTIAPNDESNDDVHPSSLFDILPNHDPGPVSEAEADERRVMLHEALERLPIELREIVSMAYFDGRTLQDVATTLHLPLGTVKSRLHRALAEFKRSLS